MAVDVSTDHDSLSKAAAHRVQAVVTETLAKQDQFGLALAGGSTPRRLYERLADADLPWSQIHLFWGDERVVPHDHPESNVQMVRNTLLDDISIPDANVHPIPTEGSPEAAAASYADVLHHAFADRSHTFDLALLGMGADGHTASLFPEHDPRPNDPKWVRAVSAPPRHDIAQRITCTLPVLNAARRAYVLVSGASKRETVDAALNERDDALPITRVRPREPLVWFLDEAARPNSSTSS
jgi:6-phosphogluconolactonase